MYTRENKATNLNELHKIFRSSRYFITDTVNISSIIYLFVGIVLISGCVSNDLPQDSSPEIEIYIPELRLAQNDTLNAEIGNITPEVNPAADVNLASNGSIDLIIWEVSQNNQTSYQVVDAGSSNTPTFELPQPNGITTVNGIYVGDWILRATLIDSNLNTARDSMTFHVRYSIPN